MNQEDKIKELERRIKELEEAVFNGPNWPFKFPEETNPWKWPNSDDQYPDWPKKFPDMFPETRCPKCGVNWDGTMGYCCPDHECPMGAGPTII